MSQLSEGRTSWLCCGFKTFTCNVRRQLIKFAQQRLIVLFVVDTAVKQFTDLYPVGPTVTPQQQDFWGSLSAMDAQIGRVRSTLQSLGVAEDTLVWFTSDNGPEVNQPGVTRGLVGRKRDFTEGGIRMPSILEWPARISKNHNITAFPAVSNDILPTVLDIWGVEVHDLIWCFR